MGFVAMLVTFCFAEVMWQWFEGVDIGIGCVIFGVACVVLWFAFLYSKEIEI